MKRQLFMMVCGLMAMVAAEAQPLMRTHVETGEVEATPDGTDLSVYKAIPYAAAPVGDLRWKAPQPAKSVDEALPVMVFIHGGAFRTEHYGGDLWQSLARRGVVAVSLEYRARRGLRMACLRLDHHAEEDWQECRLFGLPGTEVGSHRLCEGESTGRCPCRRYDVSERCLRRGG